MPTAARRPKMTVLSNSAHGTTYRTRYTRDELNRMSMMIGTYHETPAMRRLLAKIKRSLCRHEGCTCGDNIGER